jgi:peroxiredoxin
LRQRQAELDERRAVVLVIAFEAMCRVQEYCRRHAVPFRCLVDEGRTVYQAYGLGRASWSRTLTPRSLAPYIRLMFSPRAVRRAPDQDVRQRGGDVVIGRDGRVMMEHMSDDPADRPTVDAILDALD